MRVLVKPHYGEKVYSSILETRKIVMWEFCVKPHYGEKAKLFCMDTNVVKVNVKIGNTYADISKDAEKKLQLQITN